MAPPNWADCWIVWDLTDCISALIARLLVPSWARLSVRRLQKGGSAGSAAFVGSGPADPSEASREGEGTGVGGSLLGRPIIQSATVRTVSL